MKTRILSTAEKSQMGADMAFTLDYTDVAALGAATDGAAIALLTDPGAGTKVQVVGMKVSGVGFDGAGTGNLTLSVGYSGAETALLAATQIAVDSTEVLFSVGTGTSYVSLADATDINAYFDSSGVNLDVYTSGVVTIYMRVEDMKKWPVAS